jgi:glycosyltransferase involved in cell wall biosynthesis
MNRVCILFDRLGPYHWARLNAAGALFPTVGVEVSGETSDYAWEKVTGQGAFERLTLFPGEDSHARPASEVARRLHGTLDDQQPAAVAIHGWSEKAALAALSWCLQAGRPAIMMSESKRTDAKRHWPKEMIKRCLIGMCASGIGGGVHQVDYLVALGMPRERIFTGYGVVDNAYFAQKADAARREATAVRARLNLPERFFVACNRFIEKKNLPRLIEAYGSYRKAAGPTAWKLVLLGDGPLKPLVLKLREDLELTADLLLPGFQQYDELPAYYGLASAFVHASTTEQWGLVVNEAMAAGLPVLVSRPCGCVPDLVDHGRNGFTFDPFDVKALARLLHEVAGGRHDLAAMGQCSREMIAPWSPAKFARSLQLAAEIALSSPRPRAGMVNQGVLQLLLRR